MKQVLGAAVAALLFFTSCSKDEKDGEKYQVQTQESYIQWTGYAPSTSNEGRISIDDDFIFTKDGKVTGGEFGIPLSSINVTSRTGVEKQLLEDHLKTADFFNAVLHPSISFKIKSVKPVSGDLEGIDDANYDITGDLVILGKPLEISFPAKINVSNNTLEAEALMTINRLNWGMTYGSDPNEPQHYIIPEFDAHLVLKAVKK